VFADASGTHPDSARAAREYDKARRRRGGGRSQAFRGALAAEPTVVQRALSHFALGFSFIGILSFLQLLISLSLLGPVHHLRNPLLRGIRGGRRDQDGPGLNGVIIVVFVLIGVGKALYGIWRQVGKGKLLSSIPPIVVR
jgi:hypothetical protein